MRIVFLGPPGAGKGTQATRLTEWLSIAHLSTGDILRQAKADGTPVGKMAAEYLDSGRLVPDPVIVQVVGDRLQQPDCQAGCLFDGFPRTLGQAQALDEHLTAQATPLDLVLYLDVPEQELVTRLTARGRDDDNIETIRRRFQEFEALTKPLLEYYEQRNLLRRIDGIGTPEDVFHLIQKATDEVRNAGPRNR
jgi:adenylate kinase